MLTYLRLVMPRNVLFISSRKTEDRWSHAKRALGKEAAVQIMDEATIPNSHPRQSDDEDDEDQINGFAKKLQ